MQYEYEDCKIIEIIWNSRDGVTPFCVGCQNCDGTMRHINWQHDACKRDHKSKEGDRIFIDLTFEKAKRLAIHRMVQFGESEDSLSGDVESLARSFMEPTGQPDCVVFGKESKFSERISIP